MSELDAVRNLLSTIEPSVDRAGERQSVQAAEVSSDRIPISGGRTYLTRAIQGRRDVDVLRDARSIDAYPLLEGPPGSGKTSLLEACFGDELHTVNCHADMEASDLVGTYTQDADGAYVWTDGPAVIAAKLGQVLFLDDVTLAPANVLAKVYPLMDGRRSITVTEHAGETVEAQEGFFVVGAHNPGVVGAMMSEALWSRFALHVRVDSDLVIARELGVPFAAIDIARRLNNAVADGRCAWAPQIRELLTFKTLAATFGEPFAASNLLTAAPEHARPEVLRVLSTHYRDIDELAISGAVNV